MNMGPWSISDMWRTSGQYAHTSYWWHSLAVRVEHPEEGFIDADASDAAYQDDVRRG